jgi:hypothetical protein
LTGQLQHSLLVILSWISFVGNGFTLHFWLSSVESLILLSVILAGAKHVYKRSRSGLMAQAKSSEATRARFVTLGQRLRAAKLNLKLSIIPTWTEEQEARNIDEQVEIARRNRYQGFSFFWSTVVLLVLALSWSGWAWLAIHDHEQIVALQQQIRQQEGLPPNTVTTHGLRVITRINDYSFSAWTLNPSNHEWEKATYNICHGPFKLSQEITAGATIRLFQYQEDNERSCMDMSSKFAGYTLERNEHGEVILASDSGSPPAP